MPSSKPEGIEIHCSEGLGFRIKPEQFPQTYHQGRPGNANNHAVDLFGEDQSQADEEDQAGQNRSEDHPITPLTTTKEWLSQYRPVRQCQPDSPLDGCHWQIIRSFLKHDGIRAQQAAIFFDGHHWLHDGGD